MAELAASLVGGGVAVTDVGVEQVELRSTVPGTYPEVQTAAAHKVDDDRLFGKMDRVVERGEHNCGADAHPARVRAAIAAAIVSGCGRYPSSNM